MGDGKGAVKELIKETVEGAEETVKKPEVRAIAQFGFYSKGFLFIVLGSLALMLVFGIRGGRLADATGVLAAVAESTWGKALLAIFALGAVAHGFWNILRGFADIDDAGKGWQGIAKRVVSISVGVFYVSLGVSAFEILFLANQTTDSSQAEEAFIAVLMAVPVLGSILAFLIGLGLVGAGVNECYSGISGKYKENYRLWEIKGPRLALVTVLGIISFCSRAVLLAVMGYFFIRSAAFGNDGPVGMDAALLTLLRQSYGPYIVCLTAIGLIGNGLLALLEARYRRLC